MECAERRLFATQFHPEVRHTPLRRRSCCATSCSASAALRPNWTMDSIIEDAVAAIREARWAASRVILGLSGGVDSSVVAALVREGHRQAADLRVREPRAVAQGRAGSRWRRSSPSSSTWTSSTCTPRTATPQLLAGRDRARGEAAHHRRRSSGRSSSPWPRSSPSDGRPVKFLAQGTIYPDIIESGARKTGGKASTIKSHHNLIPFPEGVHFDLIEPLDHFFKDEVRALGTALGLPDHIVHRQPFPGPGLAIRIIGDRDAREAGDPEERRRHRARGAGRLQRAADRRG